MLDNNNINEELENQENQNNNNENNDNDNNNNNIIHVLNHDVFLKLTLYQISIQLLMKTIKYVLF